MPRRVRVLATGTVPIEIVRPDSQTLSVRPEGGFLVSPLDWLFWSPAHPFAPGEVVEMTGLTATVKEVTEDGRPAEVAFRFSVPLEDPSLSWLQWGRGVYIPFTPPPVGEIVHLPAVPMFAEPGEEP